MGIRGKKSKWHSGKTKMIRVPVEFAELLMAFAVELDDASRRGDAPCVDGWMLLSAAEYSDLEKRAVRGDLKRKPKGFQ